jgi:xanthine dehydrogenase accessory factor
MIGSKTKRATFKSWLSREVGRPELFDRLICPIGGTAVKDKRPAVIAALAAAEIMTVALNYDREGNPRLRRDIGGPAKISALR